MIEPCPNPWCESEVVPFIRKGSLTREAPTQVQVECGCGIYGPACNTEAEAIAAWNTRTPPASQSDDRWKDSRELIESEKWDVEIARRNKVESQSDEALVDELTSAVWGVIGYDKAEAIDIARAILPILRAREAAAYAAGRAEMRKEAVGYAKNLALEFEKGGAYDESVVATSLAEGICALGDKP